MKKGILVALIAVAVGMVSAWFTYSQLTQARLDTTYHEAIAPFQNDLRLGTDKAEVREYLDSRRTDYRVVSHGGSDTYEIKIGEEPGGLFCKTWTVYIALEFNASNKLREVHLRKDGTCT